MGEFLTQNLDHLIVSQVTVLCLKLAVIAVDKGVFALRIAMLVETLERKNIVRDKQGYFIYRLWQATWIVRKS